MARGIMRYKACKCGRELRQDVVRNDRFSLGGIAPEVGGVSLYQKGVSMYHHPNVIDTCVSGVLVVTILCE